MKIVPIILVAIVMLSGAMALLAAPGAAAAPNTITTNNAFGNAQNRFTVDGALFFSVYTSTPSEAVTILFIDTATNSTLTSTTVTTSSAGVYQSWVVSNFNFFDLTNYNPGNYKLQLDVAGVPVSNASFTISYPVYTASVHMTLSGYSTPNSYYLQYSYVYASIVALDQFGNPMSGNTSAGLYEVIYSGMANTTQNSFVSGFTVPNDFGVSTVSFYSGFIGYQTGQYNLTVEFGGSPAGSTKNYPVIGHGVYYLISPTLTISPSVPGNVYGQGTTLQFQGVFSPYTGAINVSIVSASNGAVLYSSAGLKLSGGYWNGSYHVNDSVPDGQYYLNISEYSNNYSLYTADLFFQALVISAYSNQVYYLPGEPASIFYTVTNTSNNAPATGVNVSYTMNYSTSSGRQSLTGIVSGGILNLVVPANTVVPSKVKVTLYASDSYGHNASQVVDILASKLFGSVSAAQGTYYPSQPVVVQVDAMAGQHIFSTSPVAGASASVNVSFAGSVITSYSNNYLQTDAQGIASYVFMLGPNATLGTYTVTANIRAYGWTSTSVFTFQVVKQPVVYSLMLFPGQSSYVGGQQFTATWSLVSNGTALTPAFATYDAFIGSTTVAVGTNSNGKIAFQVPAGMNGNLQLDVTASDAQGNTASNTISVTVSQALLIINPSSLSYSPSSVMTFSYSIIGTGFSSPSYFYTIQDGNGNTVASGSTTATSFKFAIPSSPSSQYTLYLTATNKSSGGVITQSLTVYQVSGLELSFSLSSSSYVSGTYSPGQKISIYYRITSLSGGSLSNAYDIYVWIPGYQSSYKIYTVSASSGTLSYTIPSEMTQGNYQIEAYALSVPSVQFTSTVTQSLHLSVSQPFWNYNVVGGVSLGSVLMGILTLVALAIAIIAYNGKKIHMGSGKQEQKQPEQKEQPPSGSTGQETRQEGEDKPKQ